MERSGFYSRSKFALVWVWLSVAYGLDVYAQTNQVSVYSFSEHANEIVEIMFHGNPIPAEAYYLKALFPHETPTSVDEALQFRTLIRQSTITEPLVSFDPGHTRIESPYLAVGGKWGLKPHFVSDDVTWSKLFAALRACSTQDLEFESILEKALLQRDLFHVAHPFFQVINEFPSPKLQSRAEMGLREVARILDKLRFSDAELEALHRSTFNPRTDLFVLRPGLEPKLSDVHAKPFSRPSAWIEIPFPPDRTVHFAAFQGRSFFRVYARVANWSPQEIVAFFRATGETYAMEANTSDIPSLPPMSQTMLVRTFGVFMKDDSYTDSRIVESVTIRQFDYERTTFDPSTDDFLGTRFVNYKLSRSKLLGFPESLGLELVPNDSPVFSGFLEQASESARLGIRTAFTTNRYNCIGCHSTSGYGSRTVLSLRYTAEGLPDRLLNPELRLLPASDVGRYKLRTPVSEHLVNSIGRQ